ADRTDWYAQRRGALDDFGDGMARRPRFDHADDLVATAHPFVPARQRRIFDEIGALNEHEKVAPLRARNGAEPGIAISRAYDRRDLLGAAEETGLPRKALPHGCVRSHRQGHDLEQREVDVGALTSVLRTAIRRQRGGGGVSTSQPLSQAAARCNRRL